MLEGMTLPLKESLCKVGIVAADLSPEDLAIFNQCLDDPRWIAETLAEELTKRGVSIDSKVIRRHRKKACVCAR